MDESSASAHSRRTRMKEFVIHQPSVSRKKIPERSEFMFVAKKNEKQEIPGELTFGITLLSSRCAGTRGDLLSTGSSRLTNLFSGPIDNEAANKLLSVLWRLHQNFSVINTEPKRCGYEATHGRKVIPPLTLGSWRRGREEKSE